MILKYHFTKLTTFRVIKLLTLLVLALMARQAVADCHSFADDGWRIGSICTSHFDQNGNYDYSYCRLDQYEMPDNRWHSMCKVGIDPGTCTGSNCEQPPTCTDHGACESDFDCCNLNWCDTDLTHKCQDAPGGPEF